MNSFLMALTTLFAALALVTGICTLLAVAWLVLIFREFEKIEAEGVDGE